MCAFVGRHGLTDSPLSPYPPIQNTYPTPSIFEARKSGHATGELFKADAYLALLGIARVQSFVRSSTGGAVKPSKTGSRDRKISSRAAGQKMLTLPRTCGEKLASKTPLIAWIIQGEATTRSCYNHSFRPDIVCWLHVELAAQNRAFPAPPPRC